MRTDLSGWLSAMEATRCGVAERDAAPASDGAASKRSLLALWAEAGIFTTFNTAPLGPCHHLSTLRRNARPACPNDMICPTAAEIPSATRPCVRAFVKMFDECVKRVAWAFSRV